MKNIRNSIKLILAVMLVMSTFVFCGCTQKQDVIHSNVTYQTETLSAQLEMISDTLTPLAAPRVITSSDAVTVTFVCDYQED